ncbi:MAG: hypothetical protein ACOCVT_00915 [bacterium]
MKIRNRSTIAAVILTILACIPGAIAQNDATKDYVWWEGEDATDTNLSTRFQFAPNNAKEASVLSGGKWLGRDDDDWISGGYAEYEINVPDEGEYKLYVRKLWKHGPFRWRFDDQEWKTLSRNAPLIDTATMRKFVAPCWALAGDVSLSAGKHRLRVELIEDTKGFAAFDAFVLTKNFFVPAGTRKPGEKYGTAPEGWFPFEPDADPYADSALLDLRSLSAEDIDQLGSIIAQGEEFVYQKSGEPVRLWSVNSGMQIPAMPRNMIDALAQYLAKRGINCVRLHGGWFYGSGSNASDVDPKKQDDAFYFIAAMKEAGIYVSISPYFQHWLDLSESVKFPGYDTVANGRPFTLHFFYEPYQKVMRDWYKAILDPVNPYTGTRLAEDPVISTFELVNEDTFFFWTFNPDKILPEAYRQELEKQFGDWLTQKYGTIDEALASWGSGGPKVNGDAPEAGRMGLYSVWQMGAEARTQNMQNPKRAIDTARFLVETMQEFYSEMIAYLRDDLGYPGPVNSTSFAVADPKIMTGLVRIAQKPLSTTDYHGHFRGAMEKGEGWNVGEESKYWDRSVLRLMGKKGQDEAGIDSVMHRVQTRGKPLINTEFSYMLPNRYHSELAPTVAIFGRELGYDQVSFFALAESTGWVASMQSFFPVQTPSIAGQWPATSILFRENILKEGDIVVQEFIAPETVLDLEGTKIVPPMFIDEVGAAAVGKDADVFNNDSVLAQFGFNPRAFLLGKVQYDFQKGAKNRLEFHPQLDSLIKGDQRGMAASSGQYHWHTGRGLLLLEAAGGQGAVGFLEEGARIDLPDMAIESAMPFGSILAVAMDGKALAQSDKILLQVMSEAQNYGYEATPENGKRTIKSMGKAPIIVRNFEGTVSFKFSAAQSAKVTTLDPNGYKRDTFTGAAKIKLQPDVLYYIIEKP